MDNRKISVLMMENMNDFANLIKMIGAERAHRNSVLTERQFITLTRIKRYKKIELKNLSKDLYVSTSSLCILLNKLVEQGYVYREEDPKDRRNTFYCITEEGNKLITAEIEHLLDVIGHRLETLNQDKKERLYNCIVESREIISELL